jgi:hypothetical protein
MRPLTVHTAQLLAMAALGIHWLTCAWFGLAKARSFDESTWVHRYSHEYSAQGASERDISSDPQQWEVESNLSHERMGWYGRPRPAHRRTIDHDFGLRVAGTAQRLTSWCRW